MSKSDTISRIQLKVRRLNTEIDLKIIAGKTYAREAGRHKMLLSQLSHLNERENHGWLNRSFRFLTLF